MLHHYHMGEVAAEAFVIAIGKIVFRHYLVVGTLKKHRVAVFVIPARPTYTGEFRHEVGCIPHYCRGLFCPAFYANGLKQPPEFQWLNTRTRAVYHAHVCVEISHVEGVLIIIYLSRGDKQTAGTVDAKELVSADGNGLIVCNLLVYEILVFGEGEIASKQGCVDMSIYFHLWIFVEYLVELCLVVDGSLEGGPHGIDHKTRTCGVEHFLKLFGNHLPVLVALYHAHIEILQVAKAVVAVVGLVRNVCYRHLACLVLQIVHAEIQAVVVAVGAAHGDQSPEIIKVKAIQRGKTLYHLAFKLQ